jgi:hypothetical protein
MSPAINPFPPTGRLLLSPSVGLALTLSAVSLLLATGATQAQRTPNLTQRAACTADFKRLGPGQMPGVGRVQTHQDELSPACSEALAANQVESEKP